MHCLSACTVALAGTLQGMHREPAGLWSPHPHDPGSQLGAERAVLPAARTVQRKLLRGVDRKRGLLGGLNAPHNLQQVHHPCKEGACNIERLSPGLSVLLRAACTTWGVHERMGKCSADWMGSWKGAKWLRTLRAELLQALPQDFGALQRCDIRILPPAVCGRVAVRTMLLRWPCSAMSHGMRVYSMVAFKTLPSSMSSHLTSALNSCFAEAPRMLPGLQASRRETGGRCCRRRQA